LGGLWAVEDSQYSLDNREKADGVCAFSVHPGSIVGTGLEKHVTHDEFRAMGIIDERGNPVFDPARGLKTVAQDAATSVWCATNSQLDAMDGAYCENCDVAQSATKVIANVGASIPNFGVRAYAVESEAANLLWSLSEQLVFGGQQS
jgi:hypothetical protein